jgi:hypothetical protein
MEIEMVCRLVKQKNIRLDEKGQSKRNAHSPSSWELLSWLFLHLWGKSETFLNQNEKWKERKKKKKKENFEVWKLSSEKGWIYRWEWQKLERLPHKHQSLAIAGKFGPVDQSPLSYHPGEDFSPRSGASLFQNQFSRQFPGQKPEIQRFLAQYGEFEDFLGFQGMPNHQTDRWGLAKAEKKRKEKKRTRINLGCNVLQKRCLSHSISSNQTISPSKW